MTPMEHLLLRAAAWVLAVGHVVGLIMLLRLNHVASRILAYLNLRDRLNYQDRDAKWHTVSKWASRALFVLEEGWPWSDPDLRDAIRDSEGSDFPAGKCRDCGCTDEDCSGCIEKSGRPCYWVEPSLCSVCAKQRLASRDKRGMSGEAFDLLLRHDDELLRIVLGGNRPPSDKRPDRDEEPTGLLAVDDPLWIPEPGDPPGHPGDVQLFSDGSIGDLVPVEVAKEEMRRDAQFARDSVLGIAEDLMDFVTDRHERMRAMLAAEAARRQCRDVAQVIILDPPSAQPSETHVPLAARAYRDFMLATDASEFWRRVIDTLICAQQVNAIYFSWLAPYSVFQFCPSLPARAGPIAEETTRFRMGNCTVVRRFPARPASPDNPFIMIYDLPVPAARSRAHSREYYEQLARDLAHVSYRRFDGPGGRYE